MIANKLIMIIQNNYLCWLYMYLLILLGELEVVEYSLVFSLIRASSSSRESESRRDDQISSPFLRVANLFLSIFTRVVDPGPDLDPYSDPVFTFGSDTYPVNLNLTFDGCFLPLYLMREDDSVHPLSIRKNNRKSKLLGMFFLH